MSQRTEEQAASLEQTAALVEQAADQAFVPTLMRKLATDTKAWNDESVLDT